MPSRRDFLRTAALIPSGLLAADSKTERVTIHTGDFIGVVRPEFHGHFAEHLGSCVYGGLWVGKNSPIPNIDGYRKAAVDYLKDLGVPVLRWPGGCFADDYHWRDGIGPRRPNVHADCSFTGATPASATAQVLHHSDMNAYNSFDDPDKITTKPHSVSVENGRLRVDLPAMSIVTVTLRV